MTKATYETPAVTLVGSFEEVTQASTSGTHLDASIPAGTPVGDLPGIIGHSLS